MVLKGQNSSQNLDMLSIDIYTHCTHSIERKLEAYPGPALKCVIGAKLQTSIRNNLNQCW